MDEDHKLLAVITRLHGDDYGHVAASLNLKIIPFDPVGPLPTSLPPSSKIALTTKHPNHSMDCKIQFNDVFVGILITFSFAGLKSDHQLVVYNRQTGDCLINHHADGYMMTSFSFLIRPNTTLPDLKIITTGYNRMYNPQLGAFVDLWCLRKGQFRTDWRLCMPLCSREVGVLNFECDPFGTEYLKPKLPVAGRLLHFNMTMYRQDSTTSPSLSMIIGSLRLLNWYWKHPRQGGGPVPWEEWGLGYTLLIDNTYNQKGCSTQGGTYFASKSSSPNQNQRLDNVKVYKVAAAGAGREHEQELAMCFGDSHQHEGRGEPAFVKRIISKGYQCKEIWSAQLQQCNYILVHQKHLVAVKVQVRQLEHPFSISKIADACVRRSQQNRDPEQANVLVEFFAFNS